MKNPLRKRIKREIFGEIGKYIAIFLFMFLSIGFISGFLVAASSMKTAYDNSFEKYNIENGNFTLAMKADDALISDIEKEDVKLYELFYKEENAIVGKDDNEATIRIYKDRKDIDLICVMDGEMPQNDDEIALDRMFADNNGISTGDEITVGDIKLKVSGLVAFSDYSALFSNNNDIMFDAVKFSVAIVTDSRFDKLSDRTRGIAWPTARPYLHARHLRHGPPGYSWACCSDKCCRPRSHKPYTPRRASREDCSSADDCG